MSGGAVAWSFKKKPIVTLSTIAAEFVAAATCACRAIWIKMILKEIDHQQAEKTKLMCDNASTIKFSKNPVLQGRSKHIKVRFHFLRDLTREEIVDLLFCGSRDRLADDKTHQGETFQKLHEELCMCTEFELN